MSLLCSAVALFMNMKNSSVFNRPAYDKKCALASRELELDIGASASTKSYMHSIEMQNFKK